MDLTWLLLAGKPHSQPMLWFQALHMEISLSHFISTLTRPKRRMLQKSSDVPKQTRGFQSSHAPKDGCYQRFDAQAGHFRHIVSTLTRLERRVLPSFLASVSCFVVVSILTDPEIRVLSTSAATVPVEPSEFQSSPVLCDGCYLLGLERWWRVIRFQSSPALEDGC